MNLYQAGYTRRGRQGEGSGWSIVSPSEDMSGAAKEGFSGIAGNLAELVQRIEMPEEAIGVFRYDRFLYYLHINYLVNTKDARGVSFTHGYCFNLKDYYTLCQNPEMLLGVTEETFLNSYNPEVKAYPVVKELPYDSVSFEQLMEKYQFSSEEYRRLLIGATCALEGYTDALCIKVNAPKEEYQQICLEIMYLIMHSLPYHLRTKITFFSYKGGKTNIYFSNKIEGNNYFDIDTGKYACDKRKLEKYQFTLIYNLQSDEQRQKILKGIADFIDKTFDIPLKDINCEQVEHGFQAKLKNQLGKAIDKDLTIGLLTSFLNFPLKESEEIEEYLAVLLDSINQHHLMIENKRLLNRVTNLAKYTVNQALRDSYLDFYTRQVIAGDKTEGYEILWEQYQKDSKQYNILIDAVWRMDEKFYSQYFEKIFLPRRLKNLDYIISYVKECQGILEFSEQFDKLLQKAIEREMSDARTFAELWEINKKVNKLANCIEVSDFSSAKYYREIANYMLWNHFRIEMFHLEDDNLYQKCGINYLKFKEGYEKAYENIQTVKLLLEQIEAIQNDSDGKIVYELFFTDNILEDIKVKEVIQKSVKDIFLESSNPNSNRDFDFILMCYYELNQNKFAVLNWIKQIFDTFQTGYISTLVNNSYILNNSYFKKILIRDIKAELENKGWKEGLVSDKQIGRILKSFYSYLTKNTNQTKESSNYSIYRIAVGYLPVFTLAFFFMCLNQYLGFPIISVLSLGIMCVLTMFLVYFLKVKTANYRTFQEYLQKMGIATTGKLLTAIGVGVGFLLSTSVIGVLLWKLPVFQQEPYYQKTLFGMVVVVVYILVAIIGAIAGSLSENEEY